MRLQYRKKPDSASFMSNKILILQKICLRHYPFWPFIWRVCPIGLISKERSCDFKYFCSTSYQECFIAFEKKFKMQFKGPTHNSLMDHLATKWKMQIFLIIVLSSFCSSVHFKMLVVFEILKVKDLLFWLLRSTNDQINGMIRLWSTNGTTCISDF